MSKRFSKNKIMVADEWVPVECPYAADYFSVRCDGAALLVRTGLAEAESEDTIPAGVQDGVTSGNQGSWVSGSQSSRFGKGEVVCYLKRVSGSSPVAVNLTFVL